MQDACCMQFSIVSLGFDKNMYEGTRRSLLKASTAEDRQESRRCITW